MLMTGVSRNLLYYAKRRALGRGIGKRQEEILGVRAMRFLSSIYAMV